MEGRQLASTVVEALKHEGHVLVGKGAGEMVLGELSALIQPVLVKVMPSVLRAEVHGEVTSTFGDEATDEAIEELVEVLREALIESDGIEDVFAEDKVIERLIFRTLHEGLIALAATADEEVDSQPPISVRLHTLGYVAATAARLSDEDTVRDALERAALAASTELDTFDPATHTAIFAAREDDPDKRLEIEEAVEEELADLVDMGFVDLPRVERSVALPFLLNEAQRKSLAKRVAAVADTTLTNRSCPAVWEFRGESEIRLGFTPFSEPDGATVDALTAAFASAVEAMLLEARSAALVRRALAEPEAVAPPSSKRTAKEPTKEPAKEAAPPSSKGPSSKASPKGPPSKPASKPSATHAEPKRSAPKKATPKKAAAKKAAPKEAAPVKEPKKRAVAKAKAAPKSATKSERR